LFETYTAELAKSGYAFSNEYQNEIILFITMNYLSNTVQIENQRSTNAKTKQAVEKIFMYITSTFKDSFIESIKSISLEDLRYF
jgi:DNA polymerase II large subunit